MILFIFEGKKREPELFDTLQKLFFPKDSELIVCSFGNNLYQLYKELKGYNGYGDIVALLKEKALHNKEESVLKEYDTSDFSEIYLFFDYDFQNRNVSLKCLNNQLEEMLSLFNDETDNGKLYINYPMVESIRYTKKLPDAEYYTYIVTRSECVNFKHLSGIFSYYGSFDFLLLDKRKACDINREREVSYNWKLLIRQNVCKANYICSAINDLPKEKSEISQQNIFNNQLHKYVNNTDCKVAILNSFPIFLYEYFK